MLKKFGRHALGFGLFLFVFISVVALIGFGNNEQFNSGSWLAANARDRGRMAQDLVDSSTLVGKNAESVHASLGNPEKNWGSVYQYQIDLGWPMKSPTSYGLQVHFDQERNVKLVKIVD